MPGIERPFNRGDHGHMAVFLQSVRELPAGWYEASIVPKAGKCEKARGYLHGCVVPIYGAYLGECNRGQAFDDDEAWEALKRQFRPREYVNPATGAVEVVGRSTKGMSRFLLFELTVAVVEWLEGQGVYVPPPDKDWKQARERAMAAEATNQRKAG